MTVISVTTVGYREVAPALEGRSALHDGRADGRRRDRPLHVLVLHGAAGRGRPGRALGPPPPRTHARRARQPLHHLRLRPHGADHRPRVRAAGRALRRHRARPRAHAGSDRARLPGSRGGREQRSRSCKRIRIDRARGFIAAVSTDAENVYAVLTARLLRPNLFIIGRAETDDAKSKLVRAGADRVVSPYQIGGLQLAQTALRPAVVDFVQLATSSDNLELNMEQVQIGQGACARRSDDPRRQPAAALRCGRHRHPACGRTHGVQSRARHVDARRRPSGRARPAGEPAGARKPPAGAAGLTAWEIAIDDGAHARRSRGCRCHSRIRAAGRPRVHGGGGTAAGVGHRARRRRPGVGDLRPEQGPRRHRIGAVGRPAAPAGGRDARRAAALVRATQRQRRARRHPGAVAAAGGDGEGARRNRCSTRSIRPRTSTGSTRSTSAAWCRGARTWCRARRPASSRCSIATTSAIAGRHAVVIGRSEIVGKPMAMLLLQRDATVTICHSKTPDLPAVARQRRHPGRRDRPSGFVTPEFVKPGATVIDVGITPADAMPRRSKSMFGDGSPRLADFERRGSIVVGDVHPTVAEMAGCADASARRRGPAHDRDAAQEHGRRCARGAPRAA